MTADYDLTRIARCTAGSIEELAVDDPMSCLEASQVSVDVPLLATAVQLAPGGEDIVAVAGVILHSVIAWITLCLVQAFGGVAAVV